VPVRVVDPSDASNEGVRQAGFVYDGAFDVLRADPTSGARAGGTRVTVRGRGFRPGLAAAFDTTPAASVTVQDPFTAVLVAPRGNVGTVDLVVDSAAGDQVTLDGAFTYFDPTNANGGSSGGPLNGTINVTVLDGGDARNGVPLPNAFVILGTDDATHLQGVTDNRGQITFSDPTLVKAQIVTVTLEAYQSVTVINQESENLTVFMIPNFEPAECANGLDDDGDGLIDTDGAGDPTKADIDGCRCSPFNSPMPDICMCPMNPQESAACCDGKDDDGDGLIDGEDPDCVCSGGSTEGPLAACSNCLDDDGDGRTDYFNPMFPPDSGCSGRGDNDERGSIVAGRVFGFKLPGGRVLADNEQEIAFVRISVPYVYAAQPFVNTGAGLEIGVDGGSFAYEFPSTRFIALYAVYGIKNLDTNAFEPLLMGVRRGVSVEPGRNITDANIILDMHLTQDVTVNITNPPSWFGAPGSSQVFAYMDLDNEGIIPVGSALTSTNPGQVTIENLPMLSGESFMFYMRGFASAAQSGPYTATFRRQAGDLSNGISMGPLPGLTRVLHPLQSEIFTGEIEWTAEPGPTPDIAYVQIDEPTLAGPIPQWQMVLPGNERRVLVPPDVVEQLRAKYPEGTVLMGTIVTAIEPRFSYDQWNYQNLFLDAFTSYTVDGFLIQL
jgi:IPT/TIG domain